MYLEKSILTTGILILSVIVTFAVSFYRKKNFLHSLAAVCLCYCYYALFMNTLLPFPLDFVARYQFDGGLKNQFIPLFSDNVSFYIAIAAISVVIGVLTPLLFPKCRKYWRNLLLLIIPVFILLFQFAINMAIGGEYKFVDATLFLIFAASEAIGYAIQKLFAKLVSQTYVLMDKSNKDNERIF